MKSLVKKTPPIKLGGERIQREVHFVLKQPVK